MKVKQTDLTRDPCPDRIVEDIGGAFGMGSFGGFLWHFGKGLCNAPKGERFATGFYTARSRAPALGGSFAVWGGTFSSFDCSVQYLRGKDDYLNAIASGALTGGVLSLRSGWKASCRQAVVGGILLAVIEGVMVIFSRTSKSTPRDQYYEALKYEESQQNKTTKTSFMSSFAGPIFSYLSNSQKNSTSLDTTLNEPSTPWLDSSSSSS